MTTETTTSGGAIVSNDVNTGGGDFVGRDKISVHIQTLQTEIVNELQNTINQLSDKTYDSKRELFREHIDPVFSKLEQIQRDYEQTILEIRRRIATGNVDFVDLLNLIIERSLGYRVDRLVLRNIDLQLALVSSRQKDHQTLANALMAFSQAIKEYFSFGQYHMQLYSMLRIEVSKMKNSDKDMNKLKEIIETTLFGHLEHAWEDVARCYLQLKGLCLS